MKPNKRTTDTIARIKELKQKSGQNQMIKVTSEKISREYKGFWIHLYREGDKFQAEVGDETGGATCFETDCWASWRTPVEECETWIEWQILD